MKALCVTGASTSDDAAYERLLSAMRPTPPDDFEVRDKGASDRRLLHLLRAAGAALPRTRIFANGRFDLALASRAAGVILPADGLSVASVRRETPRGFLIGRSTHSIAELRRGLDDGVDLLLLGPIFDTPAKRRFGPPLGIQILSALPDSVPAGVEIFLIGGINLENLAELAPYASRFSGIAAIRMFEDAEDPSAAVRHVRAA